MEKKHENWEPDVKRAKEIVENMKEIDQQLKDDAGRRKIDGFNPNDLLKE